MLGSRTWLRDRKKVNGTVEWEWLVGTKGGKKRADPPGLDTLAQSSPRLAWPCLPPFPAPLAYRWQRSWWSATRCPGWWSFRKHAPSPSSPEACRWLTDGPCRVQRTNQPLRRWCFKKMKDAWGEMGKLTSSESLHQRKSGAGGRTGFCWTWAYFSGRGQSDTYETNHWGGRVSGTPVLLFSWESKRRSRLNLLCCCWASGSVIVCVVTCWTNEKCNQVSEQRTWWLNVTFYHQRIYWIPSFICFQSAFDDLLKSDTNV